MSWLDITLVVALGIACWRGLRNGFVMEVCTLLALGLGIWGAIHFSDRVAEWLQLHWELGELTGPVAFLLTFLLILVVVNLIGRAITKALSLAMLSWPNKIGGAVFALIKYALILSMLVQVMEGMSLWGTMLPEEVRSDSRFYQPIRSIAPNVVPAIKESKWVQRTWQDAKEASGLEDGSDAGEGTSL